MKSIKDVYTVSQAARILGVSVQALRKALVRYKVECPRIGRMMVLRPVELFQLQERRLSNPRARGQFTSKRARG